MIPTIDEVSISGRRANNEDSILKLQKKIGEHVVSVIAVADGMGGHNAGDFASNLAIAILDKKLRSCIKKLVRFDGQQLEEFIENIYSEINRAIRENVAQDADKYGMGTTLVMAIAVDNRIKFANVGDSRGYFITNQNICQKTEDHSVIAESISNGTITREDAKHNPYRHALTRCLDGESGSKVDFFPDKWWITISVPTIAFVCSDGLMDGLDDSEIFRTFLSTKNLKEGCKRAAEFAFHNGSQDNISIVALEFNKLNRNSTLSYPAFKKPKLIKNKGRNALIGFLSFLVIILIAIMGSLLFNVDIEEVVRVNLINIFKNHSDSAHVEQSVERDSSIQQLKNTRSNVISQKKENTSGSQDLRASEMIDIKVQTDSDSTNINDFNE